MNASELSDAQKSGIGQRIENWILGLAKKVTDPSYRKQFIWSFASIVLALLVSSLIMLIAGYDPGLAYVYLAIGAFSRMDLVLYYATPLILTGLSVALAFKCGLFNIGAEGQLYIGSMAAALMGYLIALPIVIHPLACLAIGAIAGGLWGFVPGLLKAYRGAHEVVTTMMLSYTAILLTGWLVSSNGPFWDGSMVPRTPPLLDTALLPPLWGYSLHTGLILSIIAVFAVDFLINRTVLGYEMRAVGLNPDAAEYGGINSKRNIAIAMGLSGGLSGLAGSEEIMGTYGKFVANWSPGLGWDGITVAVLGNNSPWGVLAAAIFFGGLRAGGNTMHQVVGVPIEMVSVIQGLVVLFVAAPRIINWLVDNGNTIFKSMKEDPFEPSINLVSSILGLAILMLGLGMITSLYSLPSFTWINAATALVYVLVAILGVMIFIVYWSKRPDAGWFMLLAAVLWTIAGVLEIIGAGMSALTSFILAIFTFVLWLADRLIGRLLVTKKEDDIE